MVKAQTKHYGVFVLRTPLFTPEAVANLQHELRQVVPDYDMIAQHIEFNEALWLANPRLYSRLRERELDKYPDTRLTLEKYVLRMSQRATPFGISAGLCGAHLGQVATVQCLGDMKGHRALKLDAGCAELIKNSILRHPALREHFSWHWNDARAVVGQGELVIADPGDSQPACYRHYFIPDSRQLARLRQLVGQEFNVSSFINSIAELLMIEEKEARKVFDALASIRLIIPDVTLPMHGSGLLQFLNTIPPSLAHKARDVLAPLNTIAQLMGTIPKELGQSAIPIYQAIRYQLAELPGGEAVANPVQIDLITHQPAVAISASQGARLVDEVTKIIQFNPEPDALLKHFKTRFTSKYGSAEVPLLLALDRDFGIGYGFTCYSKDDLLQDASFLYDTPPPSSKVTLDWLNQYILQTLMQQDVWPQTLELPDTLFMDVKRVSLPPSDTLAVVGTLIALDPASDRFSFWLRQLKGHSAVTWLGRFCESDAQISNIAMLLAEDEQQRCEHDTIMADVIYASHGRDGNVTRHSAIREYEIEYFQNSRLSEEHIIRLSDITVSVKQDQVVLRSSRLNKYILPRLSSAHNTRRLHHPALYQFFGDVFRQSGSYDLPNFDGVLRILKRLPQISCGSLILKPASWWIDMAERSRIMQESQVSGIEQAIIDAAKRLSWPEYVSVGTGDQLLDLNLNDNMHRQILYDMLINDGISQLSASFANTFSAGEKGLCYHELYLPFRVDSSPECAPKLFGSKVPKALAEQLKPLFLRINSACRVHANRATKYSQQELQHAERWVFFSIRCGRGVINPLLTRYLLPLLNAAVDKGKLSQWFFIRYDDPHSHLRLRLQGDVFYLRHAFFAGLQEINRVFSGLLNIIEQSYQPEFSRYGGVKGVHLAESIFCFDSLSTAQFLRNSGEQTAQLTEYALSSVDSLLTVLGLSVPEKYLLMNIICEKYYAEFNVSGLRKRSLDKNYRRIMQRSALMATLSREGVAPVPYTSLRVRNQQLIALRKAEKKDAETELNDDVIIACIPAYIHMCMNRLFSHNRRLKEMMICDFLRKTYESHLVREHISRKERSLS